MDFQDAVFPRHKSKQHMEQQQFAPFKQLNCRSAALSICVLTDVTYCVTHAHVMDFVPCQFFLPFLSHALTK
jgi:hypothetical protein